MSAQNVERIRRFFEAWAHAETPSDRLAAISEFCEPDVEWHSLDYAVDAGTYRGREAVWSYLEEYRTMFADIKTVPEQLIDAGGAEVVAVQSTTGRPVGSPRQVRHRQATVFTLGEERIHRAHEYATRAEALEAAGLAE